MVLALQAVMTSQVDESHCEIVKKQSAVLPGVQRGIKETGKNVGRIKMPETAHRLVNSEVSANAFFGAC
jgi:hypothetical protein